MFKQISQLAMMFENLGGQTLLLGCHKMMMVKMSVELFKLLLLLLLFMLILMLPLLLMLLMLVLRLLHLLELELVSKY